MSAPTIRGLVDAVHAAAVEQGMDLAPSDVAFIISAFLEGWAHGPGNVPEVDAWLQRIADEVATVKDE